MAVPRPDQVGDAEHPRQLRSDQPWTNGRPSGATPDDASGPVPPPVPSRAHSSTVRPTVTTRLLDARRRARCIGRGPWLCGSSVRRRCCQTSRRGPREPSQSGLISPAPQRRGHPVTGRHGFAVGRSTPMPPVPRAGRPRSRSRGCRSGSPGRRRPRRSGPDGKFDHRHRLASDAGVVGVLHHLPRVGLLRAGNLAHQMS